MNYELRLCGCGIVEKSYAAAVAQQPSSLRSLIAYIA